MQHSSRSRSRIIRGILILALGLTYACALDESQPPVGLNTRFPTPKPSPPPPFTVGLVQIDPDRLDPANRDPDAADLDHLDAEIGGLFLVEHYYVSVSNSMLKTMERGVPGGILFWNGNKAGPDQIRSVVATYSRKAQDLGAPPMLFSVDHEGGGWSYTPDWENAAGVQRFIDGFTRLAHPRWLGVAYRRDPKLGRELARLHGAITARELRSVGINLPLGVVADLGMQLMIARGIDEDHETTSVLISEAIGAQLSEPQMVAGTKHFPGLGQATADTHDGRVVSPVTDPAEGARHLEPFRALVARAGDDGAAHRLAIICSHAAFPLYDADRNTTVSPAILQHLLRDETGFRGIALSDAMWMGDYGDLNTREACRLYLQSFIAGMDLITIQGSRYPAALDYFQNICRDDLPSEERWAVEETLDLEFDDARQLFIQRAAETVLRLNRARNSLSYATDTMDAPGVQPQELTRSWRTRYQEILSSLDERWKPVFAGTGTDESTRRAGRSR